MVKLFNNKVFPGKINHKNAKKSCQRVAKGKKGAKTRVGWQRVVCMRAKIQRCFRVLIAVYEIRVSGPVSSPCILPSHTGFKNIFIPRRHSFLNVEHGIDFSILFFLCVCQRTTIDHGTVKSWHFALTSNGEIENFFYLYFLTPVCQKNRCKGAFTNYVCI